MENVQNRDEKKQKRIERIVLCICTIYVIAMFIGSMLEGWSIYAKEITVLTALAGWIVYFLRYRNYTFRAKFISVMAWVDMIIFALHTDNFTAVLSVMTALIVLLAIFCIPQIIWPGALISTALLLYHGFIARTISVSSAHEAVTLLIQILSVYAVSLVMWIMMRNQKDTSGQLIENIRELEIAEQSKDDFLVNISHEIRTPINAVCGMSEAILQENLPESVRRDIIDIQTAGRNLLSTVSNILDFSELGSGKLELVEESYNITSTITDIINMALTFENGKHLEMIVDCDANLPSNLLGDEQKFRRIILNLLENAIKFTKEGGVILRIKSRKEEYGINLVVSVKDSGIGMEQADLEKIFSSFSQINSKRNREEGGVGLGLAITQALIRSMGGFITVQSTPGVGSEFRFTIPQKVLDETPIVSIRNKKNLFAACYINMDRFNYSVVREGYEKNLRHVAEQLGIMIRNCRNLPELKRRMEHENYTHIFIGWDEYCEDRSFFEQLAKNLSVVLILDYGREVPMGSNMLRIYKPFTVLSIAAVFNGQKNIRTEEQHANLRYRFIAPKAKVLVVDDNAMNLKVMARLLLPYQIKVSMASSGQEALEKLDSMDYDCVFLDHMMPEMDGVETLHKIRQKPGSYFQSLTVIAFTANAIGGAREMFISEGFDDFIAKPIELSVLERMLRRHIPLHKQVVVPDDVSTAAPTLSAGEAAGGASGVSPTGTPEKETGKSSGPEAESRALTALANAGVNIEKGIAYCGDKEGLREFIGIYHEEGAKRREKLEQLFEEQDWKNYVIAAHTMKSNSRGIGADELADLAMNLETAGKENRIDYILAHHEALMEKHDAFLLALEGNSFVFPEGYRGRHVEETAIPVNTEKPNPAPASEPAQEENLPTLAERLALLKDKLQSFESEGISDILDDLAQQRYRDASQAAALPAELTEKIREMVNEFDFLGASDLLNSWEGAGTYDDDKTNS